MTSYTEAIIAEWHKQIDSLAPSIDRAVRRGERVRVKLYAASEIAGPHFEALANGHKIDRIGLHA